MNIINNGSIYKYKYKIFDTGGLIELCRDDKSFITQLTDTIKLYRSDKNF